MAYLTSRFENLIAYRVWAIKLLAEGLEEH